MNTKAGEKEFIVDPGITKARFGGPLTAFRSVNGVLYFLEMEKF